MYSRAAEKQRREPARDGRAGGVFCGPAVEIELTAQPHSNSTGLSALFPRQGRQPAAQPSAALASLIHTKRGRQPHGVGCVGTNSGDGNSLTLVVVSSVAVAARQSACLPVSSIFLCITKLQVVCLSTILSSILQAECCNTQHAC